MTPSLTPPTSSEERFHRAFEAHYQPIHAWAVSRLTERATADDVVAEVFTTAWRRVDALPGEPETRPWLFGVARNVLRNARRSVRRRGRLTGRLASLRTDEVSAPQITDDDALAAAMNSLGADDREMLLLVAWDGLTPSEVATVFEITPNAARLRLHRARRKVADQLDMKWSSSSGHDSVTTTTNDQEATS